MSLLKGEMQAKDFTSNRRTKLWRSSDVRPLFLVLRHSYLPLYSTRNTHKCKHVGINDRSISLKHDNIFFYLNFIGTGFYVKK